MDVSSQSCFPPSLQVSFGEVYLMWNPSHPSRTQQLLQDNCLKEQSNNWGVVGHFWHELRQHCPHSTFIHLRLIFRCFIKCYPLVLNPWLQDCFNPLKSLRLLQRRILPYFQFWTFISVISLVLERWARAGSQSCWNLSFSMCGWVNFQLLCFPKVVHCAAHKWWRRGQRGKVGFPLEPLWV